MKRTQDIFLLRAYDLAVGYGETYPTSVDINPWELGKSIGLNEQEIQIAVQGLINYGFVQADIGFSSLFITAQGVEYADNLKLQPIQSNKIGILEKESRMINKNNFMKQSEKLDLILKELYKYKNNGNYYSIGEICQEKEIPLDSVLELNRLAHRLQDDHLINAVFTQNDCNADLTSHGIDYCEQDSYTYSGKSIITNNYNFSISNSPNSNIVSNSSNFQIDSQTEDVYNAIKKIKEEISKQEYYHALSTNDILECLIEIEEGIRSNQKPKFAIKSLIELGSGISSIASWLTTIGQFAGIVPKL